jgi:hypothetical protein
VIRLIPVVASLTVFDKTAERDIATLAIPAPIELIRVRDRRLVHAVSATTCPPWASQIHRAAAATFTS